jgi:hypothetical protein
MYQDTQQQFQQLAEIQREAGVDFEEMMFFDGEPLFLLNLSQR